MAATVAPSLKIRDWDTATKVAGLIALLAGGLWSVWIFHQTSKQQATAAEIDARRPFAAKRLEVYEKIVNLTAAIAQPDLSLQTRRARRQELEQIVNGPLALVAQDKLFAAINEFYRCADNRQCSKGSLGKYSRNVARACRASLEDSWKVSLPPVPASDTLP